MHIVYVYIHSSQENKKIFLSKYYFIWFCFYFHLMCIFYWEQINIRKGNCFEWLLYRYVLFRKITISKCYFSDTQVITSNVFCLAWKEVSGWDLLSQRVIIQSCYSLGSLFMSLFVIVFIPKGHYSERSLFRKVIGPKDCYFENRNIRTFFFLKLN